MSTTSKFPISGDFGEFFQLFSISATPAATANLQDGYVFSRTSQPVISYTKEFSRESQEAAKISSASRELVSKQNEGKHTELTKWI